MNVTDLVPPGIELGLVHSVSKKQSGKRVVELMKKDASRFIAGVTRYPVKLENQLFLLGIVRDITEQSKLRGKGKG